MPKSLHIEATDLPADDDPRVVALMDRIQRLMRSGGGDILFNGGTRMTVVPALQPAPKPNTKPERRPARAAVPPSAPAPEVSAGPLVLREEYRALRNVFRLTLECTPAQHAKLRAFLTERA